MQDFCNVYACKGGVLGGNNRENNLGIFDNLELILEPDNIKDFLLVGLSNLGRSFLEHFDPAWFEHRYLIADPCKRDEVTRTSNPCRSKAAF